MSYIPDYRSKENEKLLSEADTEWLAGYRAAMTAAEDALTNALDNLDRDDPALVDEFETFLDINEIETVCSLFESADYIPEDADIKDVNAPFSEGLR